MSGHDSEFSPPPVLSYCTDTHCRETGPRHLHEPHQTRPSVEQRIAELEKHRDIMAAEIVKLWNRIGELS